MVYFVSDLHGEYDLFRALLRTVAFSPSDEMYICGDMIDKGPRSVALLKFIFSHSNMHCIMGNHEHLFVEYYHALMERSPNEFDTVMQKLQAYFPNDGALLDWETVDRLEALPYYIETRDFLCVHAGIPVGEDGWLAAPSGVMKELLIHDRVFKNADIRHRSPKCVFFGHTPTAYVCGSPKVLAYLRRRKPAPYVLQDFCKIHLDTGACDTGVLGCFCLDTCKIHYIKKRGRA